MVGGLVAPALGVTDVLILVDWSNLLYRAWFSSKEQPWLAYVRFFDMVRLCVKKSRVGNLPLNIIFTGESRVPLKRTEIYPEYKSDRKPPENPEFREYRKRLVEILECLGWPLVSSSGYEADDVIATLVNHFCHICKCTKKCADCHCADAYTTEVVIFSGDSDLLQLLAWDRTWVYKHPGKFIDKSGFFKEHGFPVEYFQKFKALVGDTPDNIQGVPGFGRVKARIAVQKGTVEEDIWAMGGQEALDKFNAAMALINLNDQCTLNMDKLWCEKSDIPKLDERVELSINMLLEELK